ncbi:MAG: hypothetical protein KAR85_03015 [Methanosarcinales archaeon]|nr:hypothetical protein [Methanosarcinales archaeon]
MNGTYDVVIIGVGETGLSSDIVNAAATGLLAARGITSSLQVDNYGN